MKRFLYILTLFVAIFSVSCKKKNNTVSLSSEACLTSFYFSLTDSTKALAAANFTIQELKDTGYVFNADSIQFGTSLEHVIPRFTFSATPGSALLTTKDTSLYLTGSNVLNLSEDKQPVYLTVQSSDGTKTKVYRINIFVHHADPDLFTFRQLSPAITADQGSSRALLLNDEFVYFSGDGYMTSVYRSTDGAAWSSAQIPAGLPAACMVRSIISGEDKLYYADSTKVYESSDALSWTSTDYSTASFRIRTMLMYFNDTVWAVVERTDDKKLCLAKLTDSGLQLTETQLPDQFPISHFATAQYLSKNNRPRALVLGGYARNGQTLSSRWSFEYSVPEKKYRVRDLSSISSDFGAITGASLLSYNDQLYLIGGLFDDGSMLRYPCLVSSDEGVSFTMPDTTKYNLHMVLEPRYRSSAVVRQNTIFIMGGQTRTEVFSDVVSGRLNSIDWDK